MKKLIKYSVILFASLALLTGCAGKDKTPDVPDLEDPGFVDPGQDSDIKMLDSVEVQEVALDSVTIDSDLKDISDAIYTSIGDSNEQISFITSGMHVAGLFKDESSDTNEFYFGKDYDYKEAYVSESGMSTSAYSFMLIRTEDEASAKALASEITETVDPAKWICVFAEATEASSKGNLVAVVMANQDSADAILNAFNSIK